jgi:hypothetical protein
MRLFCAERLCPATGRAFLLHAALRISAPFGGLGGGLINQVCGSPYSGGVAAVERLTPFILIENHDKFNKQILKNFSQIPF